MHQLLKNIDHLIEAPNGIEKLRQTVLQLAVQGKLTEQNPNDEPASELLKKIKAEKEKLIADGKIKKQPDNLSIKEEVLFNLPNGWEWTRIEEISLLVHYGYTASADFNNSDVRLVRITDIQNDRVDWESVPGCSIKKDTVATYRLKNNDLLIARTGGTIGKSFLVENLSVEAVFASYLIRIVPSSLLCAKYLKVYTGSQLYWSQLYEKSMGTGQPNVNGTSLKSLVISLPPLAEQHRIVEKVNELMKLIDELEKKKETRDHKKVILNNSSIDKLLHSKTDEEQKQNWTTISTNFKTLYSVNENVEKLKQAILQLAVQGKLTSEWRESIYRSHPELVEGSIKAVTLADGSIYEPASELLKKIKAEKERLINEGKIKKQADLTPSKEVDNPLELPKGWTTVILDEICSNISSGSTPENKYFNQSTGIPYLKVYNIVKQNVNFHYKPQFIPKTIHYGSLSRSILIPKDVIINIVGPPLGKTAIIPDDYPEWNCNQAITFFKLIDKEMSEYLYLYFRSMSYLNQIILVGSAGQDNISVTKCRKILFPLPPLAEQKRIVEKVNELMSLCNKLEQNITLQTQEQERLVNSLVSKINLN